MNVKLYPISVGMAFASTHSAPTDASAIKGTRPISLAFNVLVSFSSRLSLTSNYACNDEHIEIVDINECELMPKPCKYNCQNTEGSFICSCPSGFILNPDGISCRDLDECTTGNHLCQQNCINTPGSYTCDCQEGYIQQGDACHG